MGCCICRDEFEQQRKICIEIENELENALKKFNEGSLDYEDKKWYFNKIRRCNDDIEKNLQRLQEILKKEQANYIRSGEYEIRKNQLDECLNLSKIKSLKVSKIFLHYYINFNKPRNEINMGLKRKTI